LFKNSYDNNKTAPGGYIPNYTRVENQREAYHTWNNYYYPKEQREYKSYINGTLSCFCDEQYQLKGFLSAFTSFREDGANQLTGAAKDQLLEKEYETGTTDVPSARICFNYVKN
jgi:hypothetical protein